jgi:hypothetical protein
MKTYKVIVFGEFRAAASPVSVHGGDLWPEEISGFYATRVVRAANRVAAESRAKDVILSEVRSKLPDQSNEIELHLEIDKTLQLWIFDSRLPNAGFTFY